MNIFKSKETQEIDFREFKENNLNNNQNLLFIEFYLRQTILMMDDLYVNKLRDHERITMISQAKKFFNNILQEVILRKIFYHVSNDNLKYFHWSFDFILISFNKEDLEMMNEFDDYVMVGIVMKELSKDNLFSAINLEYPNYDKIETIYENYCLNYKMVFQENKNESNWMKEDPYIYKHFKQMMTTSSKSNGYALIESLLQDYCEDITNIKNMKKEIKENIIKYVFYFYLSFKKENKFFNLKILKREIFENFSKINSKKMIKLKKFLNSVSNFCLNNKIILFDLKPQNILYDNTQKNLKLIDFEHYLTTDQYIEHLKNSTNFPNIVNFCNCSIYEIMNNQSQFLLDEQIIVNREKLVEGAFKKPLKFSIDQKLKIENYSDEYKNQVFENILTIKKNYIIYSLIFRTFIISKGNLENHIIDYSFYSIGMFIVYLLTLIDLEKHTLVYKYERILKDLFNSIKFMKQQESLETLLKNINDNNKRDFNSMQNTEASLSSLNQYKIYMRKFN